MITYVSFIVVMLFFIAVIESVRRGILESKYSILWIITCIVLGTFSINVSLLEKTAAWLDVFYAPSILFLFGLLFSLVMIFDLTRRLSKLTNQMASLTQEHALLKQKMNEKEIK